MIMHIGVKNQVKHDERGFASLVVALIMILVLSLITVGFAQLARREQQNALNKQLSSQAYYAAEAGINDAYNLVKIKGGLYDQAKAGTIFDPKVCLNTMPAIWRSHDPVTGVAGPGISSEIDANTGSSYSCVMVDLRPRTITYSGVSPGSYRDVVFSATKASDGSPSDVSILNVYWGSADGHNGLQTGEFKPQAGGSTPWGNSMGVVQLSITPLPATFSRDTLITQSYTVYLYPKDIGPLAGTTYNVSPEGNASVAYADCGNVSDTPCKVPIDGIPAAPNYLIHFTNYYDSTNIKFDAKSSAGDAVGFQNGQVVIDSTGKGRDVLKRLQVHMPLTVDGSIPDNAIEGQSVCKRLSIYPGNPTSVKDAPSNYTGAGKACDFWGQ